MKVNKRMKISRKKSKYLWLILGIILLMILNSQGLLDKPKDLFFRGTASVQGSLWKEGRKVSDKLSFFSDLINFRSEREKLLKENNKLRSEIAKLKELERENRILRQGLNISSQENFELVLTQIIAKGSENLSDSIFINKGKKDGILENMAVVSPQKILVGKVSKIYDHFSKITLIFDKASSINVRVQSSRAKGILAGEGMNNLTIDLIKREEDIKSGDIIITSGLGESIPKGILVGGVIEVQRKDIEPFQRAKVKSYLDFGNLEEVFIITGY